MADLVFPFRFHPAFRAVGLPLGIRPDTCWVVVAGERFIARFGPWELGCDLDAIESVEVTGPYAWPRVIGPAHLSLADRGLTFATNPDSGVCLRFRRPMAGIDPFGLVRHPGLTVTVEDPAALAELLDRDVHPTAAPIGSSFR